MIRRAGILAHLTSLPLTTNGGPDTHRFLTWLRRAGFRDWQILPVGPIHAARSPYASPSSFAGNLGLIDPANRSKLRRRELEAFVESRVQRPWLEDWLLYAALRRKFRKPWYRWPRDLRRRNPSALRAVAVELHEEIEAERRVQCQFAAAWSDLRKRTGRAGVKLVGDLPFYPAHDSADLWAHPELFRMDRDGRMELEAGVPPDRFADDGQRWQTPLYRWTEHRREGFKWWLARIQMQMRRFDTLRLDHFRGFVAGWGYPDTGEGRWVPSAGYELLSKLSGNLLRRLFAEDLGAITPAVRRLRDQLGLPGTRVLQFGFDTPRSLHHPTRHPRHAVVYTGTHDNNTVVGWLADLHGATARRAHAELGTDPQQAADRMVRMAFESPAESAFVPLQDLLRLDSRARMNIPGRKFGNWRWRVRDAALDEDLSLRVRGWLRSARR